MANRFPLIVDSSNQNIKELPDGDSLLLGDSEKLLLGDGTDLQLYHDGSNSYLANSTGALKLATESSGIAITIGHSTSETTIGDNLVITGDLSVGGVTLPETIADTVGAMVSSNTESGITVAYDDADNTLDFTVGTLNQDTTGSAATLTTARTIGGVSFDGSANIDLPGVNSAGNQNVDAALVDAENFKINGGQGTDGQVLTSTGSGVAWENASGGGSGATFKEGGTNFTNSLMVGDDATGTLNAATGNTGLGKDVFAALTTGDNNVAVGFEALKANTTAGSNTAVGAGAMAGCTTGEYNTAVGNIAMDAVLTGNFNTAVGRNAMGANTSGSSNCAIGINAMQSNTTGNLNLAMGDSALYSNTSGTENTAIGYVAGRALTTGNYNTAFGSNALVHNTTSDENTAMGRSAMHQLTTGSLNTAVGYRALHDITTGIKNAVIGNIACHKVTTGNRNAVVGYEALQTCTTGSNNTAIGNSSLYYLTTAGENTAIGKGAGSNLTTGTSNTVLGAAAQVSAVNGSYANVIGFNVSGEGGYTTVGESSNDIRAANGTASWATISDERVKKDITDSTAGLSFINDLRPRTFNFKAKGDLPKEFGGYEEGSTEAYKNDKTNHGFIAQEVKAVIDNHTEITDGFKMWDVREDSGQQEVAEAALIPMLVKAIQELSAEVEKLKGE